VAATGEVAISFALQGYNPQTINVRAEATPAASYAEAAPTTRMQPNPVYAELTPTVPPRQKKKAAPPKKKVAAKKAAPDAEPTGTTTTAAPQTSTTHDPGGAYPSSYPWPPPPPVQ
jgi:hypothetical protein